MKKIITLTLCAILVLLLMPMQMTVAANEENLALGKPVLSSPTTSSYPASNITDGDLRTLWASSEVGAWITVDLMAEYKITEVVLGLRLDATEAHYRRNMTVELSKTPDFAVKETIWSIGEEGVPYGEPVKISVDKPGSYRYVRVSKTLNTTHVVNEVEVYGYEVDPNAIVVGQDVEGTELEGPVMLLSYLDMVGLKDEDNQLFGVNSVMTRGEAIDAVVKAFAGNININGYIPFQDVNSSHPYYKSVMTAYHMGYITGYENASFRPNETATMGEMTAMVLRAMGYVDVTDQILENNMAQMMMLAKDAQLFKNIANANYQAFITRGQMAMLFYNAIVSPSFQVQMIHGDYLALSNGNNLLNDRYGITLTQGVVTENQFTTIDGTAKTTRRGVTVGGLQFTDPNGVLDDFLGKEVIIATDDKESTEILFGWATKRNEEVVLPAKSIMSQADDVRSGRIVALDSEQEETEYILDDEFDVVKNGEAFPLYTNAEIVEANGKVRLLDNDRDGLYEVVFIEDYSLHYVKNAYVSHGELTFIDKHGNRKSFETETTNIVSSKGTSLIASRIKADMVLKVYETASGTNNKIVVYDAPVTDILQGVDQEYISIKETKHPLSINFARGDVYVDAVPGETVQAFVDENGEVIWVERDLDLIASGWTLAFLQKIAVGRGLNSTLGFRVFTIDGTWEEVYAADKVIVDGVSMERTELTQTIQQDTKKRFIGELVRYQLNSSGMLYKLDTIQANPAEVDGTTRLTKDELIPASAGTYTNGSGAFWDGHQLVAQGRRETPVFILPVVEGKFTTDSSYDRYYSISRLDNVISSHTTNTKALQGYMKDEFGYPACFAITESYPGKTFGASTTGIITNASASYMVVKDVVTTVNNEGEVVLRVSGISFSSDSINESGAFLATIDMNMVESGLLYQNEPSCFGNKNLIEAAKFMSLSNKESYIKPIQDIGFGDIIRYQYGNTETAVERVFDYNDAKPELGTNPLDSEVWYAAGNNATLYTAYYRFQFGEIKKTGQDAFSIETLSGTEEIHTNAYLKKFYEIDMTGRKPSINTVDNLERYEGAGMCAMIYSYLGNPVVALVYPY